LSKKEGKTYQLPTEAQWEYACRAGTTTRYWSGDDPETLVKVGNVLDASARLEVPHLTGGAALPELTHTVQADDRFAFMAPVGSFRPNAFGLYDMHGNAWEWCSDWYGDDYYAVSPVDDPKGSDAGKGRVARGGSWVSKPYLARSAQRYRLRPDYRADYLGFRVARTQ
jgi:formylglycine-generating enzyme required for sulfatase activity